jgi:hypothetical protein
MHDEVGTLGAILQRVEAWNSTQGLEMSRWIVFVNNNSFWVILSIVRAVYLESSFFIWQY